MLSWIGIRVIIVLSATFSARKRKVSESATPDEAGRGKDFGPISRRTSQRLPCLLFADVSGLVITQHCAGDYSSV